MSQNALRPKLVVPDADAAIRWYVAHLGATEVVRYEVAGSVVFAELEVFGTALTLKDQDETDPAPASTGTPGPVLDVVTDEPDAIAAEMIQNGAVSIFPVADQPYGARGGRVRDPFAVQWLLQTPVTMSPEQVRTALG
ncbi:VOC family protein [Nocardioides sp.]|uniref:VOC family protein n=1 Tax=Nocardioides sp. TaxID=35761 RepID=UPI002ED8FEBF